MRTDAAEILKRELDRRCRANARYSLRAFAKALGISPAGLSLVINRKRPPSPRTIARLLEQVELDPLERAAVLDTPSPVVSDTISLATVKRICDWVAYGILSLLQTKGFRSDLRWIASRLGISVHEARASLDALEDARLIDRKTSPWRPTGDGIRINNLITTAHTRAFHRQLTAKAMQAMEDLPSAARDISSITFAMSPEHMAQAKEEIRRFRLRMSELFEQAGKSTEVYNLTVQLVPITRRP